MAITTINPYSGKKISEYREDKPEEVKMKFQAVRKAQESWGKDIDQRIDYFRKDLKPALERNLEDLAKLMSSEMGKSISQSRAEINKTIKLVDYAVENARKFLAEEPVKTEADHSFIRFEPLGTVFLIMPWNYPLWQAMRAAIPAMMSGNGIVLKHASIVTGTAKKIEEIAASDIFSTIVARGSSSLEAITHADAVSFTGSTNAGSQIAMEAGKNLKKAVLELGGSDPFIVLKSADIEKTAKNAAFGRLQNNGQSCIASKRFLVHEDIFDEFYSAMKEEFLKVKVGDQLSDSTFLGPLSSSEQAETVRGQIRQLSSIGKVESMGNESGSIVPPTLAVTKEKYTEEVFGPVAIIKKFRNPDECMEIANETPFGLGSSIWGDAEEAAELVPRIKAGMVFINHVVASDPRLPFGGVKKSGYGRELSRYGMLEFTNIKSVWSQNTP